MLEHTKKKPALTVGRTIMNILPAGSINYSDEEPVEKQLAANPRIAWLLPPIWPTDLFVTAAHLIHVSGLLTYFDPDPDFVLASGDRPISFTLSSSEREESVAAGVAWSTNSVHPRHAYHLWEELFSAWDAPLRASTYAQQDEVFGVPKWWKACIQLLILADEACVGVGAPPTPIHKERWLVSKLQDLSDEPFLNSNKLNEHVYRADRQRDSYGIDTDSDVACAQPKGRVSSVGMGLRNLSKNIAYVPHVGNLRCHWMQPISSNQPEDADGLDILIVPFPFEIADNCIKSKVAGGPDPSKRPNWGNFEIVQAWLSDTDALIKLVSDEVRKAKRVLGKDPLNGIIFPEYALTEPLFNEICRRVKEIEPMLEFAVSGSSSNCDEETGNFVLTAIWGPPSSLEDDGDQNRYLLTSRRKHHRWRLSPDQIATYDLSRSLSVDANWWETHCIAQREVHLFHFRKTSVFTTMICEDLARNDPCHDILRAIGPNLLFALLMDGPQMATRWPSRYAATLADDPGTSVLTVTSMALINRSNGVRRKKNNTTSPSRQIALWRDETGETREISLKRGAKSLLLQLSSSKKTDQTLDGRIKTNAWSWRYKKATSLS